MKNLVIIPTYNEYINSKIIYNKIRKRNSKIDILFIDDKSPDKTYMVVKKLQQLDSKLFLIIRKKKLGIGSAHKKGFLWARRKKYKSVITIDSDLSHDPNLINKMILMNERFPIIITGRFLLRNTLDQWPIIRKFITITRHNVIKFLFSIPYDTSGAFRCYNFNKINFNDLLLASDNGYSFFWQSLIILYKKGYKIKELPMIQPIRINGESKISIRDIYTAFFKLIFFYITKKIKKSY
jgi:dolichol-phosphate mannosyltransferase